MKNLSLDILFRPTFSLRAWFCLHLVSTATPIYCSLQKYRKPAWGHTAQTLQKLPVGTLGHAVGEFLTANNMCLQPHAEEHDVFHVLLGFPPTVIGEASMQFALLGNGRRSLFVWTSVLLGWILFPEYHSTFRQNYREGQRCRAFSRWRFEHLLQENTADMRDFIFRRKDVPAINGKFI